MCLIPRVKPDAVQDGRRSTPGYDRQKKIGPSDPAGVEGDLIAEGLRRPVHRVVVEEGPAALHHVGHGPQLGRLPCILVIPSPDRKSDPVPGRHDDAGGPDLHVKFVDLPGFQRLHLIVGVIRTVFRAALRVELAVRRSEPALAHRCVGVQSPGEDDPPCRRDRKTRSTRKRSASAVDEETKSLAATGPMISVSFSSGGVVKVKPSRRAS